MKQAFKFLETNTVRPMISDVFDEDELIENVSLSDAQWACKLAVKEELEYLLTVDDIKRNSYIKTRLEYLKNKKIKINEF